MCVTSRTQAVYEMRAVFFEQASRVVGMLAREDRTGDAQLLPLRDLDFRTIWFRSALELGPSRPFI